jgi:ABC-type enterochelin transport system ATPase subunit
VKSKGLPLPAPWLTTLRLLWPMNLPEISIHITADDLHDLFFNLRNDFGHTFIIVTHDDSFAERSDRIIHIKDGIIEE